MRSVVDHDIREHNAVMTVVADKPVHGDEETSSLGRQPLAMTGVDDMRHRVAGGIGSANFRQCSGAA